MTVRGDIMHCVVDNPKILVWQLPTVLNYNRKKLYYGSDGLFISGEI